MYSYNKATVWKNIERAREQLRYSKKELAEKLGMTASTYSDCVAKPIDMRLSYAMEILAGVGLTLDEALRDNSEIRYFSFLSEADIDYNSPNLPKDCLLRDYDLKALLPTFYDAINFCRDKRIVTIIQSCLVMRDRNLYRFFCTTMGGRDYAAPWAKWMQELETDGVPLTYENLRSFDAMREQSHRWHHVCAPNIVTQFWENGIHNEFGKQVGFSRLEQNQQEKKNDYDLKIFAERLGVSVGQLTKYIRKSRGEQEKANSEPRLSRAVHIANALGKNLDYLVEPIYSLEKWTTCDIDAPAQFQDVFTRWYNRFYGNFRNIFQSFVLLQVFVERFRVSNENERNEMESLAKSLSTI